MTSYFLDPKKAAKKKRDIELLPEPLRTKYKRLMKWHKVTLVLLFLCALTFILGFAFVFVIGLNNAIRISLTGWLCLMSLTGVPVLIYWIAEFVIARLPDQKRTATGMLIMAIAMVVFTNYLAINIALNFDKIFLR